LNVELIKQQLEANPNDPEARWKHGCLLAFSGRWEEAWPELEWRFKGHRPTITKRAFYPRPNWDGSNCRVLIYQEQGFGDLFQYVRYIHELKCPYILHVQPEVYNLLKYQNFNVVMIGDPLPEYDQVCGSCSLPYHFKRIIAPQFYLQAPKTNFKLEGKIGIAWAGNPDFYDDGHRSCDPSEFLPLSECGELVSLMIKKTSYPFTDLSMKIRDFADTAEIIDQLDCVVTVDTAVAHLAGALGKTVHLALSYKHDWRWQTGETTPWYPTFKLYRQSEEGNWKSVFNNIKEVL
jgi:hypothetical protein